jgi:hypothetical protein
MFWTEEDIEPAVNMATQYFGPQAQYRESNYVFIGLQTSKFGMIWYGDFDGDYIKAGQLADIISSKIHQKVKVVDLGTSLIMN